MAFLRLAGASSGIIALFHVAIALVGAPAYRYFGAGERMARLAEQGSALPALATLGIAVVFAIWSAYGFTGSRHLRWLPYPRLVLTAVGGVYALRGLVLLPQVVWFFSGHSADVPLRHLFFSLAALLIGLVYLAGVKQAWQQLSAGSAEVKANLRADNLSVKGEDHDWSE